MLLRYVDTVSQFHIAIVSHCLDFLPESLKNDLSSCDMFELQSRLDGPVTWRWDRWDIGNQYTHNFEREDDGKKKNERNFNKLRMRQNETKGSLVRPKTHCAC